ncbi:MAG: lytic transglycosylase domain-containing protein [Gemmatimonadota bacterium]
MAKDGKRRTIVGLIAGLLGLIGLGKATPKTGNGAARGRIAAAAMTGEASPVTETIVGSEWDLPVERNERVDYWIDFLTKEKRDRTEQWLQRLGYYAPMIQAKLEERGMPRDLVFLAMAESGFDPTAYSRAHASGIWQFVAETGRRYGLEVSEYVDERNDPIKSTDAALDYLQELYDRFGSWYLAAAAYNTGENRVERILNERAGGRRGDESLYWEIGEYLPRETRDYVPIMLAVGHIAKDPEAYGFKNVRYEAPMRFEEIRVEPGKSLEEIAEEENVDLEELRRLNAHLVRGQTPPDREWNVRIPVRPDQAPAVSFA